MEQNGPSGTAIGTAVHRAAHLLLDEDPKILVDPYARAFAGYASDAEMLQALASVEMIEFPRMRAVFTLRSRYAEDELASAMTRGIDQYIILGAGLELPLTAEGVVAKLVERVSSATRATLMEQMRRAYCAELPDGPRSFAAVAWACRGTVPD